MNDLTAEVRAALAKATPGRWVVEVDDWTCAVVLDDGLSGTAYIAERLTQGDSEGEDDANLIANAPSWLAALCDRLDAAEAKLAAVRELHRPVHLHHSRTGLVVEVPCPSCSGKAGTHECGCRGEYYRPVYCDACSQHSPLADYYPCPTIIALNGDPNA